ncbi:MAG TPA: extracellular solute-binding protein [Thermomicrobiales bacterium]|nr:extracellular solute-binding protein [Thermomicrobiales bacterium]
MATKHTAEQDAADRAPVRVDRRRFAQGVAASAVALGLAGQAAPASLAQEKTKIKFWTHTHPPMVDLNKQLIKEFMEANPDIEVEYEIIPNNDFATKMLASMGTGTGPDIINMDDAQMRSTYIPKGLVQEVDPANMGYGSLDELKAAYIPTALEGSTVDGKVYGVPSEFNVTAMAVNDAAFTEVGLDPKSPPVNWDEVATQGEKLSVRDGDTLTRRGFDFVYLHSGWYHNLYGTLLLQTGGRYVAPDGKTVTVADPEAVEALQIWYDLIYKYKIADPNVANQDATVPYQDFLDGKVVMMPFNPWGMGQITEDAAVYDKWSIAPLPQLHPGSADATPAASPAADGSGPVTPLYAYYWAVNALTTDEAKKAAAFKFIGFISSHPGRWLKDVSFIQPKTGWESLPEATALPFFEVWSSEMLKGQFLPVVPAAEQVDTLMKAALEQSLFSGEEPQQALEGVKPQIEAAIANG